MSPELPTAQWLATIPELPALTGPPAVAERLVLLVHYGINWSNGWVAGARRTYWDRVLPERILIAACRADTIGRWWSDIADELESQPRTAAQRTELAHLLAADPLPVLQALRNEYLALAQRVHTIADAVRTHREEQK